MDSERRMLAAMKQFALSSSSERETVRLGKRIGRLLKGGMTIGLVGNLGSGKTTLIKGIASGVGVPTQDVKSPTFVLFHVYKGKFPVYHFDLYRLSNQSDLEMIGFNEFANDPKTISVVEWAEKGLALFPRDHLMIELADEGSNCRKITVRASGQQSELLFNALSKQKHSGH